VKLSELKEGETYWFCSRQDWIEYNYRDHTRYPVRLESLTRYQYRPPSYARDGWHPDQAANENPAGRYLRAIIPGDPEARYPSGREDRVVYVEPRNIRATLADFERIHREAQEARQRARVAQQDEANAAKDRRDALRRRAEHLGLTGLSIEIGRSGRPAGTLGEPDIDALLNRLEAAEAREREAFTAGLKTGDVDELIGPASAEVFWAQHRARLQKEVG
jgi:hypothetical protein